MYSRGNVEWPADLSWDVHDESGAALEHYCCSPFIVDANGTYLLEAARRVGQDECSFLLWTRRVSWLEDFTGDGMDQRLMGFTYHNLDFELTHPPV